jgi:nicotinamide-nucleotide amidase
MFAPHLLRLAETVLADARAKHLRLALAESCTGGLIAACLTEIPGASDVVERGFVTYSNRAKTEMLGVSADLIKQKGAVSEEVARAMAEGALAHSAAQLAIAVSGVAGPGGCTAEKPVGFVHIAAARTDKKILHETQHFGDIGRAEIRLKSVEAALKLLQKLI